MGPASAAGLIFALKINLRRTRRLRPSRNPRDSEQHWPGALPPRRQPRLLPSQRGRQILRLRSPIQNCTYVSLVRLLLYVNDVPVLIQGHLTTLRAVLLVTFAGTAKRVTVEGTVVLWAFGMYVSAGRLRLGPVAHALGLLSVVVPLTLAGRIRHVKCIWQRRAAVQLRTSKQAATAAADELSWTSVR